MKWSSIACLVLAATVSFACLTGCRSKEEKMRAKEEDRKAKEAEMKASIPADSPLAKVEFGMTEGEVGAILGAPTAQDSHTTGKQWIPFNFSGKDTFRTVYYYKGVGRVEFSSGSWGQRNGVVVIKHDPSEPGYATRR
jgi:hypothetical protein